MPKLARCNPKRLTRRGAAFFRLDQSGHHLPKRLQTGAYAKIRIGLLALGQIGQFRRRDRQLFRKGARLPAYFISPPTRRNACSIEMPASTRINRRSGVFGAARRIASCRLIATFFQVIEGRFQPRYESPNQNQKLVRPSRISSRPEITSRPKPVPLSSSMPFFPVRRSAAALRLCWKRRATPAFATCGLPPSRRICPPSIFATSAARAQTASRISGARRSDALSIRLSGYRPRLPHSRGGWNRWRRTSRACGLPKPGFRRRRPVLACWTTPEPAPTCHPRRSRARH